MGASGYDARIDRCIVRGMTKPPTPPRSVRVPDELWQAAKDEAARRDESLTDAIVRFLTRYARTKKAS